MWSSPTDVLQVIQRLHGGLVVYLHPCFYASLFGPYTCISSPVSTAFPLSLIIWYSLQPFFFLIFWGWGWGGGGGGGGGWGGDWAGDSL